MGGKKKSLKKKKPDVNKDLEGLEINIDSLGMIQSTYDIDKINDFLDAHVHDRKLDDQKSEEPNIDVEEEGDKN